MESLPGQRPECRETVQVWRSKGQRCCPPQGHAGDEYLGSPVNGSTCQQPHRHGDLLRHMVVPFQEVIHAWRVWCSLNNLLVPRVKRVLVGTVSVPMPGCQSSTKVPHLA